MGFVVSDLVIESVLREGFTAVRRDPTILDDVFAQLKQIAPVIDKKYGDKEVRKIKEFFQNKEVSIVQAFSQVVDNLPCISIQLIDNTESLKYAHLDDWEEDVQKQFTDPEKIAALVILSAITVTSYDAASGTVYVTDGANLDAIHANQLYVDSDGNEFPIIGGIVNTTGAKQFVIKPFSEPELSGVGEIKSSINYDQYEQRGNLEDDKMLLGIHTEERLLTIYLYILVKYILASRKKDLINRGFLLATYSGSDFTRNLEYVEPVFSRYLTVSGVIQNNWMSDKVIPIDLVDVTVLVDKDKLNNEQLDREDQTILVTDDDES